MAIGLQLELGSEVGIRFIARPWVRANFRVVSCCNVVQFLTILHISNCADAECVWW